MNARIAALSVLLFASPQLFAQPKDAVKPLLRLEAGGPSSNVTSLAWSADGKTLYAAGFDKVVRAWRLNGATGLFELDDAQSYRVPIGPGVDGALSALAVSPDGKWLATGGFGIVQKGMKFSEGGMQIPIAGGFTPEMRQERGLIYVFNTKDRSVKILKGHTGPVIHLAFAQNSDAAPKLVSAAEGWDADASADDGEVIAWDLNTETLLRRRIMPKLTFTPRPGIAASVDNNVFRALLAWHDGTLGDWNITANDFRKVADDKYNLSAALRGDKLMTGSVRGSTGRVQEWKVAADLAKGAAKEYPPQDGKIDMPLALGWIGDNEAAAVVRTWNKGTPIADFLDVFDARADSFGQRKARIELGGPNLIVPAVSAAFGAKHVAVAGFPDHAIRVFEVAGLGQAAPKVQLLKSAGSALKVVRFMKKGADLGLAVGAKQVEAVYDFTSRKHSPDVAAWASDEANPDAFTLTKTGTEVSVLKAGAVQTKIAIKEGAITAAEVYSREGTPMVAIASYIVRRGSAVLELYDGATGVKVRSFAGHTSPIDGVSFRADGKLMASTAQDQTISVWSLTDLKDTIGLRGGLGGAVLETKDKEIVVNDPMGIAELAEGDKIAGLLGKDDAVKTFKSSGAFYEDIWMRKPGSEAKLKIVRAGQPKDVTVKVRQGVDVRKPLFSMFMVRDAAGKLSDWIGWNAIGPYDASRREVEKYLGWHFNTGKVEQPTAFAFIDEYRKEYYREGLLKLMVELGDLPPAVKKIAPKQTLLVPGLIQDGAILDRVAGDFVVAKPAFGLRVTIPNYEPLAGDELTWKLDGGPAQAMGDADGNLWSKNVELPAKGGSHRIAVTLTRVPEDQPAMTFRSDFTVRYEPPQAKVEPKVEPKKEPAVKILDAELPQLVINRPEESFTVQGEGDAAALRLDADLLAPATPRPQPFDVVVEVATGTGGKWTSFAKQTVPSDQARISFDKVPLVPGDNDIRLSLKPVVGGPEQVQEVHGRFVRPPKIAKLTATPDAKRPFVDVIAEVTSPEKPAAEFVTFEVGGKPASPRKLAIEGAAGRWTVTASQVPLPTEKGKETRSTLRVLVATADGEAEAALAQPVVFAPQAATPPVLTMLEPSLRESTVSDPTVKVRFKVESDTDLSHVEVVRAGKLQKRFDAPIRTKDGTYDFELPAIALDWGVNELKLEATNDGGAAQTTVRVNVPPQPVQVAVESMQIGPAAPKLEPELDGKLPPVPIGRAMINGVVRWSSTDDEALSKARYVRVFVNGFQQLPVLLKPPAAKSRVRRFEVPVVLNFKNNNVLEFDLPELKQDAGNRRKFAVDCDQPITGQHLHVLMVAPQEKEEAKLIDGLVRALKAEKLGPNLYRTPVFEAVHVHMIARHVQLLEISSRLDRIAEGLKERARAGSPNDLVMIYYQGKDSNGPQGPLLWTSEQSPWLQLSLDDLSKNYLSRFAGGQVLILDTVGAAEELKTGDYRFAMLRRPDARPVVGAGTTRVRLMSSLEKEVPRTIYVDQLASALRDQMQPSPFQGYVPDPLRNRIRLGAMGE